jgi:hypothetical protein
VDVVGHDHVAKDIMPFALQVIKPLIHFIIGIGNLEQPQSTTTGNRDEVNAAIFSYLPANGHVGKLAFYVLRLSLAQSYPKRVTLRGRKSISDRNFCAIFHRQLIFNDRKIYL